MILAYSSHSHRSQKFPCSIEIRCEFRFMFRKQKEITTDENDDCVTATATKIKSFLFHYFFKLENYYFSYVYDRLRY